MMKIGLDTRLLHRRGIGRYIQELLKYIRANDKGNEYVLYRSGEAENQISDLSLGKCSNIKEVKLTGRDFTLGQFQQIKNLVKKDEIDLFHSPYDPMVAYLPVKKKIISVHPPSFERHISVFSKSKTRSVLQNHFLKTSINKCDAIIASSDLIEKRLLSTYQKSKTKRIEVIYQGVGEEFRPIFDKGEKNRIREKYDIADEFFFSVISYSQYKNNMIAMLKSYAKLPEEIKNKYHLVISGEYPKKQLISLVEEMGIGKNLKFLGFVSKSDLPVLYSMSKILFLFSPYDGFESPPLESMASGTPVIASNNVECSETLKSLVLTVNPKEPANFVSLVARLITDSSEYILIRQFGLEKAKRYTWQDTSQRTMQLYKSIGDQ